MRALTTAPAWLAAPAPGIKRTPIPAYVAHNVKGALRAVDRDIELTGTVSTETVERVRAVLGLLGK